MLELRTDYLENLNVPLVQKLINETKALFTKSLPIIVTCRDKREGGCFDYPAKLRLDVLVAALKTGVEFVDFEYQNFLNTEYQEKLRLALSGCPKGRLILSAHNFGKKFENIEKLYRSIKAISFAAIPKIAYMANHINDCFDAFDLLHKTSGQRIVICMGEAGVISRILAKKFDNMVTFVSSDDESATAPGQLTIQQIKQLYRFDLLKSDTQLYGVIGSPIRHSLSPAIFNACFDKLKMNALYLPLLVEGGKDEFDEFLHKICVRKWLNFKGFSVTIPHKQNAINFVKKEWGIIEPIARRIGAANTLVLSGDNKISAHNTDCDGALDAITKGLRINREDLKNMPVAVLGAGGVARAIIAGLTEAGCKVTIYNRTVEKAQQLASEFNCSFAPLDKLFNINAVLLINCTSVGMYPNVNESPVPDGLLNDDLAVFDTVYNPQKTILLSEAKRIGAKTIDGVSMFINQAMTQFKLFTGQQAEPKVMQKTISDCLSKK